MNRPKLLFFLHNFHNRAGTEEHVKTLAFELRDYYEIAFMFPMQGEVILRSADTGEERNFGGEPVSPPFFNENHPLVNNAIQNAISTFNPDLIHVHHLFNWPINSIETVLDSAKRSKVKTLLTFHDYYFITPIFTMQGVNSVKDALSEKYVVTLFGKDIRPALLKRIDFFREQFKKIDIFITPSQFAAKMIYQIFKVDLKVVTHGILPFTPVEKHKVRELRFGYVGSLLPQKGWRELLTAWKHATPEDAELHLYGGGQTPDYLPDNVSYHGVYEQSDLPSILSNIDIGVIPSVFPETFSIVLSEMQQAGLPVIGSAFGAIPDRIVAEKTGWIVNPYSIETFSKQLHQIPKDRSFEKWEIPKPKSSAQMAKDYLTIYGALLK